MKSKYLKKYSYLWIPIILFCLFRFPLNRLFVDFDNAKTSAISGIAGGFTGVLLTVFTVYTAFPKDSRAIIRLNKSEHGKIFQKNIFSGTIIFICCVLSWLFNFDPGTVASLFISGLGSIIISLYYITTINKYLQN